MRLFNRCPECHTPMTRADHQYSVALHREGRCQRCQWELDELKYQCLTPQPA